MSTVHGYARVMYEIAEELGTVTSFDAVTLILQGREIVEKTLPDTIPAGLPSMQWLDSCATFLRAAAAHVPNERAFMLSQAAELDRMVADAGGLSNSVWRN